MERRRINIASRARLPQHPYRSAWTAGGERRKDKREFLSSTWGLLVLHFAYCCRTTSLHCFRYLCDPKCSKKDRLLWACVLLAAVLATCRMTSDQFFLYYNNPIVYSHLANRKLIKDIPFPAVTICSQNQIPPSAFNYSAALLKPKDQLTDKEKFQLDFANYFCEIGEQRENFYELLNVPVIEEIFQIRKDFCEEEILEMEWQRKSLVKPCDFIQHVMTWYGHCYTFNMVPFERFYQPDYNYWKSAFYPPGPSSSIFSGETKAYFNNPDQPSPSQTITPSAPSQVIYWKEESSNIPWSTNDSSFTGGVTFALNFRSYDFDNTCSLGDKSFSVIVHPPDEVADWTHEIHNVHENSISLIKLFPEVEEHSALLEALPPSRRKCYIAGEKLLQFFQVYNQRNCEVECHVNQSLRQCGCVAYYHPRDENTPVCNQAKESCLFEAQQNISERCHCLPSCSGTIYNTDVIFVNKHERILPNLDVTLLYVQFPSKGVMTKVADSIAGQIDVVSNLGGLLSLFLGAGLVSLLELIYMSSLRPLVTVWNWRRRAAEQGRVYH